MSSQEDRMRKRLSRNPEISRKALLPPQQLELLQAALPPPPQFPYNTEPYETEVPQDPYKKLLEFCQLLLQNKLTIALMVIVGALASIAYNVYQVPMYQASASMQFQSSQNALGTLSLGSSLDASINTEIDILKSKTLLKRVKSKIKPKDYSQATATKDFLSPLREALGVQSKAGLAAWQEAVGKAQSTLEIKSTRDSNIIKLQCASTDPQVAADFINSVAYEYIQQGMEERWESYQSTSKWLSQAQDELRAKLEASEKELQKFSQESGLLFTSEAQNIGEDKLKQLQQALSKAQEERIIRQSQYEASKSSKPEALPEVLDNGPISGYQSQLTDLRRQVADLSSVLTPEHPKVKRLQAQISQLESISERERGNIIKRIKNEYEAALRSEDQIRSEYDRQAKLITGQADKINHYKMLEREVETNRQLYTLTLQKGKEASINSAMQAKEARVIDPANVPSSPFKPLLVANVATGLFGGLLFGAAFVIVRERMHAVVHFPGNLLPQFGIRELGVIPSAKIDRLFYASLKHSISVASKPASLPAGELMLNVQTHETQKESPERRLALVTWSWKPSVIAEAFRSTMASILFSSDSQTGNPGAIVVTSPSPSEGKTTVACNLSIALAEINHRVLLVDGDMRIPKLHNIFRVPNNWGLSDLLQENTQIEDYPLEMMVHNTEIPNLDILPSGSTLASTSNLLYSPRLQELLARCRHEYSVVLIDAPPILNVSDARILSRAADFAILVIRASHTTRDEVSAALRCFDEDGTVLLGTILNDWNAKSAGYGSYRAYSSSYRYYGNGS